MKPDPRPCHYVYWGWASPAVIEVLAIVPKYIFLFFFKQNPLPVTQCILGYLIPERGLRYIIIINPAGNFSHVTSFQRGYEVEITLRRRLTSRQRRIDVVFPTSFQQEKTTSIQRRIDVMLETMLKSG